jgi:outer membrane protein
MQRWGAVAAACAWILVSTTCFSEESELTPVLTEARELLAQGRAAEAYEFLASYELQLGGAVSFDYLLGVAALDSQRPDDAVFALERVVLTAPDFPGARMDLARAWFESGEYSLARTQFQYLLTQAPPEQTREVIERYLDAMDRPSLWARSRWSALAQAGAGYDTNANGSTSEQTFLGFTLNPNNVETSSSFGELTLGGGHTLPIGTSGGLVTNALLTHRANTDASFVDQTVASLGTTGVWVHGAYRYSGGIDAYRGQLDREDYERGTNLNLGVSRAVGDYEGAVSVRAGTIEYEEPALRTLDARRYLAGFSLTRSNVEIRERPARLGVALLAGMDDPRFDGSPYGNDRFGARFFGSVVMRPQVTMLAELSHMTTKYDGAFFGTSRNDDQVGFTLSLDLRDLPARNWNVTPRLRYVLNDSSVSLYEYDRFEAVLFLRRAF